jgi:hypothetical protein
MDRRHRNQVLLWLIVLGLANFVGYTLTYWYLGGDARNGYYANGQYHLRGHFIRDRAGRPSDPVPAWLWIYSYVHSITIWPTIATVLVSMLILARPHIIATMKSDSRVNGATFVTVCMTVILMLTGASTLYFIFSFIDALTSISRGEKWGV